MMREFLANEYVPNATHQTEGKSHQDVSKIVAMPCNAPAEVVKERLMITLPQKLLSSMTSFSLDKI